MDCGGPESRESELPLPAKTVAWRGKRLNMVLVPSQDSQARSRFVVLRRTFKAKFTFRSTWKSNIPTQI